YFGDRNIHAGHIAKNIIGSVVKEDLSDRDIFKEYVLLVAKKRGTNDKLWEQFHNTAMDALQ
ncbi:MAG: AAA family ATPase, partial [Desulfobacterales bacterium]|nr:AAA family ATPase [Desulfobacterales bacterium]